MIFRVKRLYVTVSPLFLVVLFWSFFTNRIGAFLVCLLALLLHELGHIFMILAMREKVAIFRIIPFGYSFLKAFTLLATSAYLFPLISIKIKL